MAKRNRNKRSNPLKKVLDSNISKSQDQLKHISAEKASLIKDLIQDAEEVQMEESEMDEPVDTSSQTGEMDWSESCANSSSSVDAIASMYPVILQSQVILEILDARQPLASRSTILEKYAQSKGKQIVLVLNKCDLIPKEAMRRWLTELRKEFPTYVVRSRIPIAAKKLCHVPRPFQSDESLCTLPPLGFEHLARGLRAYRKNKSIFGPLKVCVFGAPQVGKFTFISSLKSVCEWQETEEESERFKSVLINEDIKLFTNPSRIVLKKIPSQIHLMSPQDFEIVEHAVPIKFLLSHVAIEKICRHYQLKNCQTTEDLLSALAAKKTKSPGLGAANEKNAAILLWKDWIGGSIKHYADVPAEMKTREYTEASMAELERFGQHEPSAVETKIINRILCVTPKLAIQTPCLGPLTELYGNWMDQETEEEKMEKRIAKRKKKNRNKIVIEVNKKRVWGAVLREVNKAKGLLHQLESLPASA